MERSEIQESVVSPDSVSLHLGYVTPFRMTFPIAGHAEEVLETRLTFLLYLPAMDLFFKK
jgi:hypothetical protein